VHRARRRRVARRSGRDLADQPSTATSTAAERAAAGSHRRSWLRSGLPAHRPRTPGAAAGRSRAAAPPPGPRRGPHPEREGHRPGQPGAARLHAEPTQIWCAIVALAADLVAWMQILALTDHDARRWEPKRLRLRLLPIHRRPHQADPPTRVPTTPSSQRCQAIDAQSHADQCSERRSAGTATTTPRPEHPRPPASVVTGVVARRQATG
jgi:hypothetical protein